MVTMRQVLCLASMLFCLTLTPPLAAQNSDSSIPFGIQPRAGTVRYTIQGTLRDAATSRGVDGIKVELRQAGGATMATAFTTDSGEFSFSGVRSGLYEINVVEVGYLPIDQQISAEDSVGLQLWLRKPADQPDGSKGPTISVRELSIPRKAHDDMIKGVDLLYQKRDYRGSVEQFQRAIKDYPAYYEAYGQMAVAYLDLGDQASAEDALKKSIDVSQQRYSDAYFALAGLYVEKNRFADAEPIARKGAELDDASWKGHYELACALFGLNRMAEAEVEAKIAAERDPSDGDTRLLLANIHIRLHNYPAVLKDVDTFLNIDPNGPHADQARHLREQVQTALQKQQEASGEDDSSNAANNPDNSPEKDQSPNPQ
jgi:hypothetical protein